LGRRAVPTSETHQTAHLANLSYDDLQASQLAAIGITAMAMGATPVNPVKVGICRDFRGFAVIEAYREDRTTAVASPRSEPDDIRRRL